MKEFSQTKILPFSQIQMFELVADIANYPDFLPWCLAARITKTTQLEKNKQELNADLIIGFQLYKEKFTSKVILTPNERIDVNYIKGPFKKMDNFWHFKALKNNQCEVHFEMTFEFDNFIFKKLSDLFFEETAIKMIDSFENRVYSLYK